MVTPMSQRFFLGHLEPVAEDFVVGLVVRGVTGVRHELVNVTAVATLQCSEAPVVRGRARGSHSREVEELVCRVNDASWNSYQNFEMFENLSSDSQKKSWRDSRIYFLKRLKSLAEPMH